MSNQEAVQLIALERLQPFKNYPFIVRDDEQMKIITDSVRNVGILTPAIVRPLNNGFYELISGHRRKRACEIAGISFLPAIIRQLNYLSVRRAWHTEHNRPIMFDALYKSDDDNPTIGIILCSQKNEAIVKYSVLNDAKQVFASKYQLTLPSAEELQREIEEERRRIEGQE